MFEIFYRLISTYWNNFSFKKTKNYTLYILYIQQTKFNIASICLKNNQFIVYKQIYSSEVISVYYRNKILFQNYSNTFKQMLSNNIN